MADLHLKVLLGVVEKIRAPFKTMQAHGQELARTLKNLQQQQEHLSSLEGLEKQAKKSAEQLRYAKDTVEAWNEKMAAMSPITRRAKGGLNQARRASEQFAQSHQANLKALGASRNALKAAGIDYKNVEQAQQQLQTRIETTNAALEKQNKLIALGERLKRAPGAMGRGIKQGWNAGEQAYERFNKYMLPVLAPGLELDEVLSKVQALTGLEKDSDAMKALRADARAKGASTSFSAVDVAKGQAFLAQAGFKPEQIIASTQAMLDVARAGDVDLARAADITSNISSAFAIDPADSAAMTQLADQLVAGFTSANMSLEDLGETMKYFASIAKAAGMDTATSIAMTGMLGNVGIQGSEAGTALRTMTTRLAALPSEALKELDALKVSTKDEQGNLRTMADILADVDSALQSHGSADKLSSLKKIFGQEALTGMSSLMDTIGQGQFAQQLAAIRASQGAAAQVASTMADNLSGDLEQLRSAAKDLSIGLFEALNPALRALSQTITPLVQWLGRWMAANPRLAQTLGILGGTVAVVVTTFGALTMALGMGAAVFTHAVPALMALKTGLLGVGHAVAWLGRALMANPIGLAITAIGLAAYVIYTHWEPISEFFRCMWDVIRGHAEIAAEFLGCMWEVIKDHALSAFNGLKQLLSWTPQGMIISHWKPIAGFMRLLWDGIWQHIQSVWNLIAGIFSLDGPRILQALSGLWESINTVLMGWPEKFQQFGINLLQGFIGGIKQMAGNVGNVLTDVVGGAVGRFKDFLGIRSPSRLFAGLGHFTLQGYTRGLEQRQNEPVQAVVAMGQRLRQAASGIVLGTAMTSAPMMAMAANTSAHHAQTAPINTHYEIHIHAAPGQDAQAIAQAVRAELDRREQQRQARQRSALNDE